MEGKPGDSEPEIVLADEVISGYEKLKSNELKSGAIQEENRDILKNIRDRIASQGIPDEVRLEAGVILAAGRHPMIERGMHSRRLLERLKEIDASLKEHGGETIAWFGAEMRVTEHRDPAPSETGLQPLLNIGILPTDAKISPNTIGEFYIPIERSVSIRVLEEWDGSALSFDGKGQYITPMMSRDFTVIEGKEAFLPLEWLVNGRDFIAVGNTAVQRALNQRGLEANDYTEEAIEILLDSFREAHNLEPELPPAA